MDINLMEEAFKQACQVLREYERAEPFQSAIEAGEMAAELARALDTLLSIVAVESNSRYLIDLYLDEMPD